MEETGLLSDDIRNNSEAIEHATLGRAFEAANTARGAVDDGTTLTHVK